ncbi:MAG: ABC transporter ATP-binding protein [Candidatus Eremiobacteraeota bacterium]|nr:ABC transporter ATP-binding protein [Candidatus Eremiobacteraeota bacterium]
MQALKKVIEVRDLEKTYFLGEVTVQALRGVSLSIFEGEFVAVMGPSGSGKSTFMNILGCLDPPTKGHYLIEGTDVSGLSSDQQAGMRNKKIGFVFQGFNLLSNTTALENVELPLYYNRDISYSAKEKNAMAMEALDSVGLHGRSHHMTHQLSGGQQQRVAIARSLVNKPSIILADEPTGNLDTRTSLEIIKIFQDLNSSLAITVVLVTHSDEISSHAGRLVVFRDGRLKEDHLVEHRLDAGAMLKEMPDEEEIA